MFIELCFIPSENAAAKLQSFRRLHDLISLKNDKVFRRKVCSHCTWWCHCTLSLHHRMPMEWGCFKRISFNMKFVVLRFMIKFHIRSRSLPQFSGQWNSWDSPTLESDSFDVEHRCPASRSKWRRVVSLHFSLKLPNLLLKCDGSKRLSAIRRTEEPARHLQEVYRNAV